MFGRSNKGPAGYIVVSDPSGKIQDGETLQCVHCGMHWIYEPGSGRERGWCGRCMGVTCGSQRCCICVPYEAQIEIMEGANTPMARQYLDDYRKSLAMEDG